MSDDLLFDSKKVITTCPSPSYICKYYLLNTEDDTTEMPIADKLQKYDYVESDNCRVCFAHLLEDMCDFEKKYNKIPNRIILLDHRNSEHEKNFPNRRTNFDIYPMTEAEITRWVELCKDNKLMPSNIGENFIKNGDYDIKVDLHTVSMNMIYILLSAPRYIKDDPCFVKAVIHMVDDLHMGFFTAFGVASILCITNVGHHVIIASKPYPFNRANINSISKFDITNVVGLFKLLNTKINDESAVTSMSKAKETRTSWGMSSRFNIHTTTNNLSKKMEVNKSELTLKETEELIRLL